MDVSRDYTTLKSYLHGELTGVSPPLSLYVKNYLVNLLCFYMPSEQFFEKKEGHTKSHECTLADLYQKSQTSKLQEKLYIFKKIGDFSLYLSGFFRSSIKRKITHISYYEQMGQIAYHFIATNYDQSQPNIFDELSREFKYFSQILFFIQKKSEKQSLKKYLIINANTISSSPQ